MARRSIRQPEPKSKSMTSAVSSENPERLNIAADDHPTIIVPTGRITISPSRDTKNGENTMRNILTTLALTALLGAAPALAQTTVTGKPAEGGANSANSGGQN